MEGLLGLPHPRGKFAGSGATSLVLPLGVGRGSVQREPLRSRGPGSPLIYI